MGLNNKIFMTKVCGLRQFLKNPILCILKIIPRVTVYLIFVFLHKNWSFIITIVESVKIMFENEITFYHKILINKMKV